MPRRILIILKGFRGENHAISTKGSTVYITDFQLLAYILQADALKFDFKLTHKKKILFALKYF